jgi:hypothetical protein
VVLSYSVSITTAPRAFTACGAAVDGLPDLSELLTVVVQRADVYAERGRDLLERQAFSGWFSIFSRSSAATLVRLFGRLDIQMLDRQFSHPQGRRRHRNGDHRVSA